MQRPHLLRSLLVPALVLAAAAAGTAEGYRKPPQAVLDVLNAPATPQVSLSPTRQHLLLIDWLRYPSIRDLARPMLRLAGLRIDPATGGLHQPRRYIGFRIKAVAGGPEIPVAAPRDAHLGTPVWAPDGKRFAFTHTTGTAIELWVGDLSGRCRRLPGVRLNPILGDAVGWMPDGKVLLCCAVPSARGKVPAMPEVPAGPNVQESAGEKAPVRTFQDLLRTPYDEQLFEYFATSQALLAPADGSTPSLLGKPGMITGLSPSPDGRFVLAEVLHRPFSYLVGAGSFPQRTEVWNRRGGVERVVSDRPLAEGVPIGGVQAEPRGVQWVPTAPAALMWFEALDGGDPRRKAPQRDAVRRLEAPFQGAPAEVTRTQYRATTLQWTAPGDGLLVGEFDRDRRWRRLWLHEGAGAPRLLSDRSVNDRYGDPGTPVTHLLPSGHSVVLRTADSIFLQGAGASPEGERPFLDRFDLRTLKSERLFRCDEGVYETPVALMDEAGTRLITRRESPSDPPNYLLRELPGERHTPLTAFQDPTPHLRGITRRLVTYRRADGVPLSFTLYLPPGYREGQRLPTLMWAYPREFSDAGTAGQVSGSPNRFTTIGGISHLFAALAGYAVLDEAAVPVVGTPEKANDTFVEQIVGGARAAIDKAVEMGVTDRDRVAVGGHSYGAFMTANLLAHSDLFRAGIARSGAYNRTLTPFGFQSEQRTLWQAPEVYARLSPFMFADRINEPLLLIHGEADDNPGTFPIQSERLFHAIKGNGGVARYVTLPHEAHGYAARESVEHTLYEMLAWLDRHLKSAGPSPRDR